jgi:hypothetical protein
MQWFEESQPSYFTDCSATGILKELVFVGLSGTLLVCLVSLAPDLITTEKDISQLMEVIRVVPPLKVINKLPLQVHPPSEVVGVTLKQLLRDIWISNESNILVSRYYRQ